MCAHVGHFDVVPCGVSLISTGYTQDRFVLAHPNLKYSKSNSTLNSENELFRV